MLRAPVALLPVAALLLAGCVPPPFDLTRPEIVWRTRGQVQAGVRAHVITPFIDERARPRCRRDSGFTADMAGRALPPARIQIVCSREIARWLAEDVAKGLADAGVALSDTADDPADPDLLVVRGDLLSTEIEPIVRFPLVMNVEADYRVRIEVRSRSGLFATRDFHLKSAERRFFVTDYTPPFLATHRRTVDEITAALVQLTRQLRAAETASANPTASSALPLRAAVERGADAR
ncbi:MAG: hypothetical protein AAGC67_17645 [Myxococcota bacterium]